MSRRCPCTSEPAFGIGTAAGGLHFRGLNVEENIRAVLEMIEPNKPPARGRA